MRLRDGERIVTIETQEGTGTSLENPPASVGMDGTASAVDRKMIDLDGTLNKGIRANQSWRFSMGDRALPLRPRR